MIDDTITIDEDRHSTINLPTDLPLNESLTYLATGDDTAFRLTIKRVNYSSVDYRFTETMNGNEIINLQGQAHLEAMFYLGSEGEFEYQGNYYGMNEYIDARQKDCETTLLIGEGSTAKTVFLYGCGSVRIETGLLRED